MRSETYADIEVLIDEGNITRYYIIKTWQKESYSGGVEHSVPVIDREIDKEEYNNIFRVYIREKKLNRILKNINFIQPND